MIECLLLALALPLQSGPGGLDSPFNTGLVPDSFYLELLSPKAAAPAGSVAFMRLDIAEDKTQVLTFRCFGLPDGHYDVEWNSLESSGSGAFDVLDDGLGKLVRPAQPGDDLQDAFGLGVTFEVRQAGVLLFHEFLYIDPDFGGSFGSSGPDHATHYGARLIAVGDDLDARGRVSRRSESFKSFSEVSVARVPPGPYLVYVGDQATLWVEVGPSGLGALRLSDPLVAGTGSASFSPVGKDVSVRDASGAIVLQAPMPSSSKPQTAGAQKFRDVGDGAAEGLQVDFIRSGSTFAGSFKRSSLAWRRDALGNATLTVDLTGHLVTGLPYELFVGDVLVGELSVPDGGNHEPFTATLAVGPELDLRGQRVEVRQWFSTPLALDFPQSVPAGLRAYHKDLRKPHRLRLDLLDPGTDLDATGRLDWRLKKGVEQLQLEVRDLPAGDYDIVIDGEVVAAGALMVSEDGGEAQQSFSTGGVLAGSLPLAFAVHGTLEIRSAGAATVWLQQDLGD